MSFSIRTIVQIINALVKHGYIEIVRRMQKEDPRAVRKASEHLSNQSRDLVEKDKYRSGQQSQ